MKVQELLLSVCVFQYVNNSCLVVLMFAEMVTLILNKMLSRHLVKTEIMRSFFCLSLAGGSECSVMPTSKINILSLREIFWSGMSN